jgi:hypothetical protein
VLDESAECSDATLTVKGWKQRLLLRGGREYTLAGLQQQQEEAEEAAAAAVEQRAAGPAAKKPKASAGAAAAAAADASSPFQTAASFAAGSAAAPILLDDSAAAGDAGSSGTAAAAANKKKRKRGTDSTAYAYTPLGEVRKRLNEKLNFYGVVIRSRPVKKTSGTDYMLGLVVGDMSLRNETDSVTFNVFRQNRSALPEDEAIAAGDIVRLHRASVKAHPQPDKPDNLVGAVPNRATGFILIKGGEGESMEPYFNSSESQWGRKIAAAVLNWQIGLSPAFLCLHASFLLSLLAVCLLCAQPTRKLTRRSCANFASFRRSSIFAWLRLRRTRRAHLQSWIRSPRHSSTRTAPSSTRTRRARCNSA